MPSESRRVQGSLEYLLLIGGAVVVAAIVVVMLLGFGKSGTESTQRAFSYAQQAQAGGDMWTIGCATQANYAEWSAVYPETPYPETTYASEFKTTYTMALQQSSGAPQLSFTVPTGEGSMLCDVDSPMSESGGVISLEAALGADFITGACDGIRLQTTGDTLTLDFSSTEGANWRIYSPSNPAGVLGPSASFTLSKSTDSADATAASEFVSAALADAIAVMNQSANNGSWEDADIIRVCLVWYGPVPA